MASSSLNVSRRKYDVFLSFRGADTRRSIVSHLLTALKDKKIEVYSDYKLEEGNEISPALLKAIEESYITLIIFSKGYVDSRWCLEELEKIINCMENFGQIVVPIFYDVVPSIVRHQKKCYGNALKRHEEKYKVDKSTIQSWKTSLKKAANLSGFDSSTFENDAELVKRIVNRVWEILKNIMLQNDSTELIGIHEQIEELELILSQREKDVQIVGIWGMGGIGKTTIASILFQKLCHEYEGYHFFESVREELEKHRITQLKNRLISKLLGEEDLGITIPVGLPFYIQLRLRHKKVLVVLDDVDHSEQLKDLTGAYDWFGPGSIIITTSRDKNVLSKYSSKIYEVKELNFQQSLQLLNLHAFKEGCLKFESSYVLSWRVVDFVKGNPLALKVIGSYLNDKSEAEWRSALEKLEKTPFPDIQKALKLSYDALDQKGKDIFLYIACLLEGFSKLDIISLLDSSLHPEIGLKDLQDKALIIIASYGKVTMHDLIQEMGRQIVREESPKDLSKRYHLWDRDDIYEVFKNNSGTKDVESMSLQSWKGKKIHLGSKAFKGMPKLKYLNFQYAYGLYISDSSLDLSSQEFKYFNWASYPLKSLPSTLCLKNLVQLHMLGSKVERLWDGIQDLGNLKEINLDSCKFLKELPDMSKASKLEIVDLTYCSSLRHIHPSILSNHRLVKLELVGCGLRSLKCHGCLRSLKVLETHSRYLEEFSMPITLFQESSLTSLNLSGTNVVILPASIKHLSNLEELWLDSCLRLQSIPELPSSMKVLWADNCRSLEAVFTSNSSTHCPHLNPRYPFKVNLTGCAKLGEDTVNAIAMDFVLATMGAIYQQPTPSKHNLLYGCSEAHLPINKVPNVLNIKTRQGCESESIQVPPNSDLMAFIFCFVIRYQREALLGCRFDARVISNGEMIKCGTTLSYGILADHMWLWYDEDFNRNIMNIIKQGRSASPSIDDCTKVSFKLYRPNNREAALEIGVCPIYASDIQRQLRMKKRKGKQLAPLKGVTSLNLSKQLLPRSRKDKMKSRKLKAIHLPATSNNNKEEA